MVFFPLTPLKFMPTPLAHARSRESSDVGAVPDWIDLCRRHTGPPEPYSLPIPKNLGFGISARPPIRQMILSALGEEVGTRTKGCAASPTGRSHSKASTTLRRGVVLRHYSEGLHHHTYSTTVATHTNKEPQR